MPDRDGLAVWDDADGSGHCFWCDKHLPNATEIKRHRVRCGPQWQEYYGGRFSRRPTEMDVIERELNQEA